MGPVEPSSPPDDPASAAEEICRHRLARYQGDDDPFDATLLAAYPTSAGAVVEEEERRRGNSFRSPFRDRDPDELLALCFFDADAFGISPPARPDKPLPEGVIERLEEVVSVDGAPYVLTKGSRDDVEPAPFQSEDRR